MKALLFTLLFTLISSANTQLKVDSMTPLHTYNHKPSAKLKNVKSYKLTHKRQLLFYRIYTQNCKIEINALDGAIISKVSL